MTEAAPAFSHLLALTDGGGLYEHALLTAPRPEHGYCVDDVARGLVVLSREVQLDPALVGVQGIYLDFVLEAQAPDGRFRNRRNSDLAWTDQPSVEDCWGRALWGLGATVLRQDEPASRALRAFERGAGWRSPWSRSMAFAALGAACVVEVLPAHRGALDLLVAASRVIGRPGDGAGWPWPEARLGYANAVLPDVLLAAGAALQDNALVADGVQLLGWLLDLQTSGAHLSLVPVGGRGPRDEPGGFDQQPIEVASLADACARAHRLTGDRRWLDGIELCATWFLGANDAGVPLYDAVSGGGCDGLEADGRNENQGAESTLALISTFQHARRLHEVLS